MNWLTIIGLILDIFGAGILVKKPALKYLYSRFSKNAEKEAELYLNPPPTSALHTMNLLA
jgi:hypothetical protein